MNGNRLSGGNGSLRRVSALDTRLSMQVFVYCEWLTFVSGCPGRVAVHGEWLQVADVHSVVGSCPSRVAVHREFPSMTSGYPLQVAIRGEWVSIASGLCNECLSVSSSCPLQKALCCSLLSIASGGL